MPREGEETPPPTSVVETPAPPSAVAEASGEALTPAPPSTKKRRSRAKTAVSADGTPAPRSRKPRARKTKTPLPGPVVEASPAPEPVELALTPTPRPAFQTIPEPTPAFDLVTAEADRHVEPREHPDDISVPPAVGDVELPEERHLAAAGHALHHDDIVAADFFDRPAPPSPAQSAHQLHLDEIAAPDPRLVQKMSPAAAKRRAKLARYVVAAVGACAAICLAAFVVERTHTPVDLSTEGQVIAAETQHAAAPPREPEPTATIAEPAAATQPQAAEPEPAPAETATAVATEPERDPEAAKREKRASQRALERFDLKNAIEQGELSVAHDPTDAEAWLILGAAYQAKGDGANMKRAFRSCLDQGKGPRRGECFQFAH
jgi:hypothetical protein